MVRVMPARQAQPRIIPANERIRFKCATKQSQFDYFDAGFQGKTSDAALSQSKVALPLTEVAPDAGGVVK